MAASRSKAIRIIGKVTAVCVSAEKGTRKRPAPAIVLREGYGVVGDAHGGSPRQVSLLCEKSLEKTNNWGIIAGAGDFAENITISGADLSLFSVGNSLRIGQARLRITQIGKVCHSACEIRTLTGFCIMPTDGIFAEVLSGGEVRAGDEVVLEEAG